MEPTDTKLAGDLEPGQAVDLPLRLKAGAELGNAASQLLGVSLKFDYDSDKGAAQGSTSEKLVLPVSGASSGPSAPTPNIILKNYSYGEKAAAGQVFLLDMELANTSLSQPVENVVMSLETGEGLSINSSSNTFYIPKLEAGQTKKELSLIHI